MQVNLTHDEIWALVNVVGRERAVKVEATTDAEKHLRKAYFKLAGQITGNA